MSAVKRLMESLDDLEQAGQALKRHGGSPGDVAAIEKYVRDVRRQLRA